MRQPILSCPMILIITKSDFEIPSDNVIDWFQYYNISYIRLNTDELLDSLIFEGGKVIIKGYDIDLINVCWLRRLSNADITETINNISLNESSLLYQIKHNLLREKKAILDYLLYRLKDKFWLTKPNEPSINKLKCLDIARQVGFNVPKTYLTNNIEKLKSFHATSKGIISKSISDFSTIIDGGNHYKFLTTEVKLKDLSSVESEKLFTSLFQEKILKNFEIRIFFFAKELFSMAIFSQSEKSTCLDYRNYNFQKPNRVSNFSLPPELRNKILKFIEQADLSTGSIDLIKEKNTNHYYFLEVNPVGQFSNVSLECNYYLEKKIAKYLADKNEKIELQKAV